MRLYLVRHAQTEWNAQGRAQGHTDIELDAEGQTQAELLQNAFDGVRIARILSSDLKRCLQTAEQVAKATGAPLIQDARLRERGFGEWEGLPFEDILARRQEFEAQGGDPFDHRPPGGESMHDVWNRLGSFIEQHECEKEPLAVVTHGGALAIFLAQIIKGSGSTARAFRFGNTAVTELERHPDGHYVLIRFNDTSHLQEKRSIEGNLEGTHR
ncbi:MAG: histidine phosphatase family protein [Fimbriimonadaceae bacterium]|nr:histidine phosphatase family protein [Fimbriimonadaceae bacterium]